MQLNQPYDPRYNAKLYVPKLTEEQRRARATPLENLRSLRFRSEVPAAPVEVPAAPEATAPAPASEEAPMPQDVPATEVVSTPSCIPTALEVLCAELPEIFAPQAKQPLEEVRTDDEYPISAVPPGKGAAWDHPRQSTPYDRSHYTALLACEAGTRSFPMPLHVDVGNEAECAQEGLRNQACLTPGRATIVDLMKLFLRPEGQYESTSCTTAEGLPPTPRSHTPRSYCAAYSGAPRGPAPPRLC